MRFCTIVCLLSMLFSGCSSDSVAVVPVEGVVKVNGIPADNLQIQFNPVDSKGNTNKSSSAVSDAQGRFVLKVSQNSQGAVVGKHKVTVWDNRMTEDEGTKPGSRPAKANRVPAHYLDTKTTPIEIEVTADKKEYVVDIVTR